MDHAALGNRNPGITGDQLRQFAVVGILAGKPRLNDGLGLVIEKTDGSDCQQSLNILDIPFGGGQSLGIVGGIADIDAVIGIGLILVDAGVLIT